MKLWMATMLAGCLCWSGCSNTHCTIDADCFAGETCVGQLCTVVGPVAADAAGTRVDATAQDMSATSGADQSTETDVAAPQDLGRPVDTRSGDDLGQTQDVSTLPDADGGDCTVDLFDFECLDDPFEPNNTWIDGEQLVPTTLGCNPDFVPVDESFIASMCPLDGSDWYYSRFVPCNDGSSYILEWQVQLESVCAADVISLEPLSFKCDESFVDCTPVDGKPTIRMIVNNQNVQNLQSAYVEVSSDEDVMFDYRIRVSVR